MGEGMEVFASISCATVTTAWLEKVAPLADANARQTVLINVGANKGYVRLHRTTLPRPPLHPSVRSVLGV